jgi:hypothetical protein
MTQSISDPALSLNRDSCGTEYLVNQDIVRFGLLLTIFRFICAAMIGESA